MIRGLVSLLLLCASAAVIPLSAAQAPTRIVKGRTQPIQVAVPEDWVEASVNEVAELQFVSPSEDSYFFVAVENRDDLFGWNLARYAYFGFGDLMHLVDNPEIDGPEELSINGNPGWLWEVAGASGGVRMAYLYVAVETPHLYMQLMGWTTRSRFESQREVLEQIISSVKETD